MSASKYGEVLRTVSSDVVARVGLIRAKIDESLSPLESTNFVTSVLVAALALSIELLVEELKGQTELDPKADENVIMIKKKLGEAIRPIIAELAGPGWLTVQKHVEFGLEPQEDKPE